MTARETDSFAAADALEREGDALAARGEACARHYKQAQALLMPAGTVFQDRAEHDRRMTAFTRLQDKLYALGPDGRPRATGTPPEAADAGPAASTAAPPAPEPWRAPALAGRLAEAVALLRGEVHGLGGMGFYAALGYQLEATGDEQAGHDLAAARASYEAALKSYLCYALMPARGDSEEDGYGFAEAVLLKLRALPPP